MELMSNIYYANTDKILITNSPQFKSLLGPIDNNKRVFVCLPDKLSPKLFSRCVQLYHPEIKIGYGIENDNCYNILSQLIYVNSEHLKCKLFRNYSTNKQIDFADILIISNNNLKNYQNFLLISFLLYADDNGIPIPKIIMDFSFKAKNQSTNNDLTNKKNKQKSISINYDYPIDTFDKINKIISIEQFDNMIIHVPDDLVAHHLKNKIMAVFSKLLIIIIDNDSSSERLQQLLLPKTKIIIAANVEAIPLVDINIVIDLMRKTRDQQPVHFESLSKYTLDDKNSSDRHINYVNPQKCHRFINKSTYTRLGCVSVNEIKIDASFIDKYGYLIIMSFYQINIDPKTSIDRATKIGQYEQAQIRDLQKRIVEHIDKMGRLEIISKIDTPLMITSIGVFCKHIPLSYQCSCFLWKWINTEYSIYYGIVLICLVHYNKTNCNLFYIDKDQENFLFNQLELWNNLIEKLGSSHGYYIANYPTIKNKTLINRWVKENNVAYLPFNKLIRKIHKIYTIIKTNYRVNNCSIKYFESNEILQYSKGLYRSVMSY